MSARITIHEAPARGDRVRINPGTHVGAKPVGNLVGHVAAIAVGEMQSIVRVDDERTGPDGCLPIWLPASDVTVLGVGVVA